MSDWLEEKIKDTWRWERLEWPRGLSADICGEYRIYERPKNGEQRFIPQWRLRDTHGWQDWFRVTWGRCGTTETVSFLTLHEAKAWLDEAHMNRPQIVAHKYQPHDI